MAWCSSGAFHKFWSSLSHSTSPIYYHPSAPPSPSPSIYSWVMPINRRGKGRAVSQGNVMAMHRQLTMALGGLRVPPPVKTQGSLWLRQYHHVTNVAIRGQAHLLLVAPPLPPPPPLTLPLLPQPPPCLAFVGSRGPEFSKAPPPLLPQPPPCLALEGSRGPEFSKAYFRYWWWHLKELLLF